MPGPSSRGALHGSVTGCSIHRPLKFNWHPFDGADVYAFDGADGWESPPISNAWFRWASVHHLPGISQVSKHCMVENADLPELSYTI